MPLLLRAEGERVAARVAWESILPDAIPALSHPRPPEYLWRGCSKFPPWSGQTPWCVKYLFWIRVRDNNASSKCVKSRFVEKVRFVREN